LDRYDFSLEPLEPLKLEDAAATLVAFTAQSLKLGLDRAGPEPSVVIACGGGRHNPVLMQAIRERVSAPVESAEAVGWRGDSIEAEAIAYCAARSANRLPITFPSTTGVVQAMTGGRIVEAT
ncbi:anhydro-N-acetylmuramic acid kinase, partial [Phenylobacterium sp.]|uniref:anhydro-N-acetylmuramic acid kinase n=1 Tax=Phenylobacterium sp. TaxID=1871053 RepID=UPI002E2EADD5